jgi:hypothetical protein
MRLMPRTTRLTKDLFSETEAAAALGVTVTRLHQVLDEHIFTNGIARPHEIQFTSEDLLLLGYWCSTPRVAHEVITMPLRKHD